MQDFDPNFSGDATPGPLRCEGATHTAPTLVAAHAF